MKLAEIPGSFSVLRFQPQEPFPVWANGLTFVSVTRTDEELSIICKTSDIPATVKAKAEHDWKCFRVQGPLDFSLTGILSSIAAPLAEAKISIFAFSTFDTDYVMVKNENFEKAKETLRKSGFKI